MSSKAVEHEHDRKEKKENQKKEANGVKFDDENPNGKERNAGGMGNFREGNQWKGIAVSRNGKDGHSSNDEWLYTLKVEKSYGAIVRGMSVTLLREYLEPLFSVTGKLGHTLWLIPYVNGLF